jgi:hypothetical protein
MAPWPVGAMIAVRELQVNRSLKIGFNAAFLGRSVISRSLPVI